MSDLSKNDKQLIQILDILKLEVNKLPVLTSDNIASIIIRAMRLVEKIKITGDMKRSTVCNLMILLIKDYSTMDVNVSEMEQQIQALFDAKVLIKKSCTCF
jgi:hypothetical protein